MSILSVDNISPIGSGTSVTVNKSVTLESGNTNITGVCTATSFSGGLPILNGADNRVITATSASAIEAEANLTFDGTTFKVQAATPAIEISGTNSNGGNSSLHFNANVNHWVLEADNYTQQNLFSIKSGTTASSTPRLTITSAGLVGINETAPQKLLSIVKDSTASYNSSALGGSDNHILRIHNKNGTDNTGVNNHTGLEFIVASGANSVGQIGLVRTGNNIGDIFFKFRTAASTYAEKFRISSQGYITAPSQPSFAAYITGMSSESANTGTQIMPFNTTNTNVGGHFKTSGTDQYKFVAPVAGNYFFSLSQNHNSRVDSKILKNGVKFHEGENEIPVNETGGEWHHHTLTCVIPLAAGDKVHCTTRNQDGNPYRAWNSNNWDNFSGFLIG
jgi:hypothetical protein